MNLNLILLDAAPAAQGPLGENSWMIMMGLIFVIMYFFMIRPQTQKQKKTKQLVEDLAKDSRIVTIGGIHAKVIKVGETTLVVEIESGAKMKIDKASISLDSTAAAYGEKEKSDKKEKVKN